MLTRFFWLFGLVFFPFFASAQGPISTQNVRAAWLQINQRTVSANEKWVALSDFQFRWHTCPEQNFHMGLGRVRALRLLKKGWNAGVGYAFVSSEQNSPTTVPRLAVPEHRPFLEANFSDNWTEKWLFQQRFVLENRSIRKTENGALADGWAAAQGRFRWRAQTDFSILKKARAALQVRISNEMMVNLWHRPGLNVFDQNRVSAGLVCLFSNGFGLEIGWTNWFQQLASGDHFLNRNVGRLAFSHNLKLKKRGE